MYATAEEAQEHFLDTTFATFDFRIRDAWDNGEFMTGATVDLYERGTLVASETFTASSEEPGLDSGYWSGSSNHAMTQALSYAHSWAEAQERRAEADRLGVHPLEIEFAPYGPAWAAEQADRYQPEYA